MTKLKVSFLPYYESNPYQSLIIEKMLEKIDFVETGSEPRKIALNAVEADLDILHLHWADFFYRETRWKTFAKMIILYANLTVVRLLGIELIWTMHNDRDHEKQFPKLDYLNRFLLSKLSQKITVWDENTKNIASEKFHITEEKLEIVPHGNYLPVIEKHNVPDKREARDKIELDAKYDSVYLFAGLIRPYKQVSGLIEAFKKFSNGSGLLLIAGNPNTQKLREKIESKTQETENIRTELQYIPEQKLINYYKATDWAIFSYNHIFNSGSIFYAMSLSTPFIAPNQGSINSFKNTENIIYEGTIKDALEDSEDIENLSNLGARNRNLMENEYSWQKIKERFTEIYN